MKMLALAAVLAACTTLAPASAQSTPPNGPGGPPAGMIAIHRQMRDQMLSALTPEHKQLLASIVGRIATEDRPDIAAAAKRLDDALTTQEKQAILSDAAAAHQRMQLMMGNHMPPGGMHPRFTDDPGRILLMVAVPPPMMMGR